jgi:hypothetical protein
MSPSDLIEIIEEHPTERLRVVMASGDEVVIETPQRTVVSGLALRIQLYDESNERMRPHARVVSIPNITLVEPIRRPPEGRRPRRRR